MKNTCLILFITFYTVCLNAQTEQPQWVEVSPFPDETYRISGMFISASEGWIIKKNEIWHTDDGAKSFKLQYSIPDSNENFLFLQMTDNKIGYAAKRLRTDKKTEYKDNFLKTNDGCKTWTDRRSEIRWGRPSWQGCRLGGVRR